MNHPYGITQEARDAFLLELVEGMREMRAKLDALHRIVMEEEVGEEIRSLDGDVVSHERDQTQSLG